MKRIRQAGAPVGTLKAGLVLLAAALLSACSGWQPQKQTEEVVESQVRQPARQDSAGVQVFPLQNPAVKQLMADASGAESVGDFGQASMLLERALRIQPQDPELLQQMAEVQLHLQDYGQALNFAQRSYDTGPRVGEICSRNWRTIAVARQNLNDTSGARAAKQKAGQCMNTKPASF